MKCPGACLRPNILPDKSYGSMRIGVIEGAKPSLTKMYRLSKTETKEMEEQIQNLLSKGWIPPSNGHYECTIQFVKKNVNVRICVN